MKQLLTTLALVTLFAVAITLAASEFNQSTANKQNAQAAYMDAYGRAQAMIITAKGEAVRDFSIAALPWAVLGIALVAGTVAIIYLSKPTPQTGRELIERRIVYYLQPGPDVIELPKIAEVRNEHHTLP